MARNKPIPRSQRIQFNRGTKISRNSPAVKDDVKNLSVGLMDMDSSIMYYFNEVIKPEVEENKEKVKVPCIYASPERWTQISKQGYLRDKKRQIITPLIVFKRTGMEKNQDIPVDKLDANKPTQFYTFEQKLIDYAEDPEDPGGYFIINGSERVIVGLEDLSYNKIIVDAEKVGGKKVFKAKSL